MDELEHLRPAERVLAMIRFGIDPTMRYTQWVVIATDTSLAENRDHYYGPYKSELDAMVEVDRLNENFAKDFPDGNVTARHQGMIRPSDVW